MSDGEFQIVAKAFGKACLLMVDMVAQPDGWCGTVEFINQVYHYQHKILQCAAIFTG